LSGRILNATLDKRFTMRDGKGHKIGGLTLYIYIKTFSDWFVFREITVAD